MRYKTKENIIDDMSTKKCWGISKEFAEKATREIPNGRFLKYSTMHYYTVYCIIKRKLGEISDPIQKVAYLDCVYFNYLDLGSESINSKLDIATGVVTGVTLGFSITDIYVSRYEIVVAVLLALVFQVVKAINISLRKTNFYLLIINQIKSELNKSLL